MLHNTHCTYTRIHVLFALAHSYDTRQNTNDAYIIICVHLNVLEQIYERGALHELTVS